MSAIDKCASSSSLSHDAHQRHRQSIAVIGGGASGIFGAIAAANAAAASSSGRRDEVQVTVLEATHKTLGKVRISGGGRCNVMHDTAIPARELLAGYPRGRKELHGTFMKRFTPSMMQLWFEKRGVELKTEADGRMFPSTDSSETIIATLLEAAREAGVEIRRKERVQSIQTTTSMDDNEHHFLVNVKSSDAEEETRTYDAVILATGSSKHGYAIARDLGHNIIRPVPSLFTLNCKHDLKEDGGLLHDLSGVSVPYAIVSFPLPETSGDESSEASNGVSKSESRRKRKRQVLTNEGPLLITHHGISGPATLRLSAFGARDFHSVNYRGEVRIHWAPSLGTRQDIADELWQCRARIPKKQVATVCPLTIWVDNDAGNDDGYGETATTMTPVSAIPRRLWVRMVDRAGLGDGVTWSQASKKKIGALAGQVAECSLEVTGKGVFKEEFVTAGGVSLKELDFCDMQSKVCPGLFCCGEVIDVDGVTGGFNFMNCWSSGYLAGNGAVQYLKELESKAAINSDVAAVE